MAGGRTGFVEEGLHHAAGGIVYRDRRMRRRRQADGKTLGSY